MAAQTDKKTKKANSMQNFFRGVRSEYKKVVWPSWKTLLNYSAVVIVISLIVALFVWGLDGVFRALISWIIN